jgi:hypothetical protein
MGSQDHAFEARVSAAAKGPKSSTDTFLRKIGWYLKDQGLELGIDPQAVSCPTTYEWYQLSQSKTGRAQLPTPMQLSIYFRADAAKAERAYSLSYVFSLAKRYYADNPDYFKSV